MARNKGGYAFIIYHEDKPIKKFSRSIKEATNQVAEVLAVISVFRYLLKHPDHPNVEIITDSMYVVGTTCQGWKVKANQELWKFYFTLYEKVKEKVTFKHVRGHQGIEGNEICDTLAVIASNEIEIGNLQNNKSSK